VIENFKKRIIDIPIEDRSSLLRAFFFFYFVLFSWYSIRPVRNEMAVQAGLENLPSLLSIVLLVMLIANPVYSWLVSRIDRNKIVLYFYLFFILNLLVFFFSWVLLDESWKPLIAKSFYIWCNVFSFFVVSIFWVSMINYFSGSQAKIYFGIISAGGSIGAFSGSSIARVFSTQVCGSVTLSEWGPFSLILISVFSLSIACFLSMSFRPKINEEIGSASSDSLPGSAFEPITEIAQSSVLKNLSLYMVLWTGLMTFGWMIALGIVQEWSTDPCERTAFFARIEQIVTPLTLICQFFVTSFVLRSFGIKKVLIIYGFILFAAIYFYEIYPEIMTVLIVVSILRTFEYGLSKPARESLFTKLKREQRYKSTVFLDTFFTRGGEVMGSWFAAKGALLIGLSSMGATLFMIPFAALLSWTGYRSSKLLDE
jgi:AAA family ATP:ADP antiporter